MSTETGWLTDARLLIGLAGVAVAGLLYLGCLPSPRRTKSAAPARPAPSFSDSQKARMASAPASAATASAVPLRNFTRADLAPCTGAGGQRVLLAVNGVVFDMSSHESGPAFYGPGGPYHCFAGRDASVGLATMETDPAKWVKSTVRELSASESDTMLDWFRRFKAKYTIVGALTDGSAPSTVDELRAAGVV